MNYCFVFLAFFNAITASPSTSDRLENATETLINSTSIAIESSTFSLANATEISINRTTIFDIEGSTILNDNTSDALSGTKIEEPKLKNTSHKTGHSRVIVFVPKHEENEQILEKESAGLYRKIKNFMTSFFSLNNAIEHDLLNENVGAFRKVEVSDMKESIGSSQSRPVAAEIKKTITDTTDHDKKNCLKEDHCNYRRQIDQSISENLDMVEETTLFYSSTEMKDGDNENNTMANKEHARNDTERTDETAFSTNYKNLTEINISLEVLPENELTIGDQSTTKSDNDSDETEESRHQELEENKHKLDDLTSADVNNTQYLEQDYTSSSSTQFEAENQTTKIRSAKNKKILKRHASRMFPHRVKHYITKCDGRGGKCSKSNVKKPAANDSPSDNLIIASTFPPPTVNQSTLKAETAQHGNISKGEDFQKPTMENMSIADDEQDFFKYRQWLWQHLEAAKNGSLKFNSSSNLFETHHFLLNSGGTEKSATDVSEVNISNNDYAMSAFLLPNENLQRRRRVRRGVDEDSDANGQITNGIIREDGKDLHVSAPNTKGKILATTTTYLQKSTTKTNAHQEEDDTEEVVGEQYKRGTDGLFDREVLENIHGKPAAAGASKTKRGNIEREWNEGGGITTRPLLLLVTVPSFIGIGIFILVLCFLTRSGGWCCQLFERPRSLQVAMQKESQEPSASQRPISYK